MTEEFRITLIFTPTRIVAFSSCFILLYWIISIPFWKWKDKKSFWKRNGPFDVATTIILLFPILVLIYGLFSTSSAGTLNISFLLMYYGLLVLFFGACFSLIEWHFKGSIKGIGEGLECEIQCMLLSIQCMVGMSYSTIQPKSLLSNMTAAVEGLLGLLFIAIYVAKAVALASVTMGQ